MTTTSHKYIPLIEISTNPAEAAGLYISDLLSVHHGRPTLLMLAGGSAHIVLDHINPQYLGSHITVTVTDERFTDDLEENNFAVLQSLPFYNDLVGVDAFCIDTQIFGEETISGHAERFEKNIRDWKAEFPKGIIIGLFGIGKDGHVAGIIPGIFSDVEFKKKYEGERLVAYQDIAHSDQPYARVSTTFAFMRMVDFPLFYITGKDKKQALKHALEEKGILSEIPARIMQEMKGVHVFTDIEI